MKVDITTYGGVSTATVNGFASVSNHWPLALAGATLKYWRSIIAKRFHFFFLLFALCAMPSALSAQELTIAYSKTGIDTLFKTSHLGEEIKVDTLYFFAPATWIDPQIFHPIREHYFSVANIEALQDRINTLESGWKNGMLYLELTKAHDAKVDSLRRYISHLESRITDYELRITHQSNNPSIQ